MIGWLLFEFLPLRAEEPSIFGVVGTACRLIGCGVALGILTTELQASTGCHGAELLVLRGGSALTALFIGNFAREWAFAFCAALANFFGRTFRRAGTTLDGRTFLEIHYPKGTWLRCEYSRTQLSYEWTEPNGRCNRLEARFRAVGNRNTPILQPSIRFYAAPDEMLTPPCLSDGLPRCHLDSFETTR